MKGKNISGGGRGKNWQFRPWPTLKRKTWRLALSEISKHRHDNHCGKCEEVKLNTLGGGGKRTRSGEASGGGKKGVAFPGEIQRQEEKRKENGGT